MVKCDKRAKGGRASAAAMQALDPSARGVLLIDLLRAVAQQRNRRHAALARWRAIREKEFLKAWRDWVQSNRAD